MDPLNRKLYGSASKMSHRKGMICSSSGQLKTPLCTPQMLTKFFTVG